MRITIITDESLGELFKKLGLITEEQKTTVLTYKKDEKTDLNFYQIALRLGYMKKGSLDKAMENFKTAAPEAKD